MAELYFRIHRAELLAALNAVRDAIPRKDEVPILQNVLLQPEGDRLTVRGTDLSIEVQTRCDLLEAGNGQALTINFEETYSIVKNLPESAEISIQEGKGQGQVTVLSGRSRYTLHFLPAADFPSMGNERPPFAFAAGAAVLNSAFRKVLYAVNVNMKDRPFLMGVHVHRTDNDKLAVVGCNGLKVAVSRIAPAEMAQFKAATIPTETINIIRRLMGESKDACRFHLNENKVVVECEEIVITSRLVDGVFLPYGKVIPARNGEFVRADCAAVIHALNRVTAISSNIKTSATRFLFSSGQMHIELVSSNGQAATETLDIDYEGEEFQRGFNASFVKDTLESISTASFLLFGKDREAPGHFTPDNDADEDYVVMPMRV